MGTSSTIKFVSVKYGKIQIYVVIYQQFDGYPESVGSELVKFVKSKRMVNGYSDKYSEFNGFGCMIAQYIASIKDGAGNLYILPADSTCNAVYNYVLTYNEDNESFTISCDEIKNNEAIPIDDYESSLDEYYKEINDEDEINDK